MILMENRVLAVLVLDPAKPRGLPRGAEGEVRQGFEFYHSDGKAFITLEMRDDPVLTAVVPEQLRVWKGAVAVPVLRVFRDGLWTEIPEDAP